MASVSMSGGKCRVLFFIAGKRGTLYVKHSSPKKTEKTANDLRDKIERLIASRKLGLPLDADLTLWLSNLPPRWKKTLARFNLIPTDETVISFYDRYVASRTMKDRTRKNFATTRHYVVDHFGSQTTIGAVTEDDAARWREALTKRARKLAPATISRAVKTLRQVFKAALRERGEPTERNPFAALKAGSQANASRNVFISRPMIERVIDACPNWQWRLIVALCRYGGMRCPSEPAVLEWSDIHWDRERIEIRSPKTGTRFTPIFPELRPYLNEAFASAPDGAQLIFPQLAKDSNIRTRFLKIVKRAGLKPWPRIFHNLRATRQTELSDEFPDHVVCAWLGNSKVVAMEHYLSVTEKHFARAAQGDTQQSNTDNRDSRSTLDNTKDLVLQTVPPNNQNTDNSPQIPLSKNFKVLPTGFEPVLPD